MLGQHSSAGLLKGAVCVLPPLELDLHWSKYVIGLGCLGTQLQYLQYLLWWRLLEDSYCNSPGHVV